MASAEQLISRRSTLIATLGRAEAFVANFNEDRDLPQVQLRIERLDELWRKLEDVQESLVELEEEGEGRREHEEIHAGIESRLFLIKSNLLSKLSSPLTDNSRIPQSARTNSTLSGIKLPTITLPEFNGDYMHWLAFHDTFLALIHSNPDVPEIQKFHYLKAAVKGEAAQLIESIAISSANYNLAWHSLKSRYSNDYLLKKRHLQALFDIQVVKKESATTLHVLVDEFERHIKVLHQLEEPTDTWSTILEHLLCTRLPEETLKAWEDHASREEEPNYTCLVQFLQRRIRVLESISVNNHNASTSSTNTAHQPKKSAPFRLSCYTSTATSTDKCPACNLPHCLMKCQKFNRFSPSERQQFVATKRLCHNCMRKDHMARNCPSSFSCRLCNRRHHTLLHPGIRESSTNQPGNRDSARPESFTRTGSLPVPSNAPDSSQISVTATETTPNIVNCTPVKQTSENVFLLTAVVKIVDAYGHDHLARALLDSASQPNLITDRMAQILKLKRAKVNVTIQGAGKMSKVVRESVFTEIKSRKEEFSCGVEFLIMDKVTGNIPSQNVSLTGWKIPSDLVLADPQFNKSQPIDMVLGIKHFYSFFPHSARIELGTELPLLVDSVFGWIIAGSANANTPTYNSNIVEISMLSLEDSIERFWQCEELLNKDNFSIEERQCETLFQSTSERNTEGRYIVRLPKKPDFESMLGHSKATAIHRFELLEKRLKQNSELRTEYHKFMHDYLTLGHMRLVEREYANEKQYYLPHHCVVKEASKTTKVRVVFDGSAKTSTGFSLNDALCVGPVVQDDLLNIILRFRTFQVALVGDIAKMYRQILVHPDDVPLQRILWRFSEDSPIQAYELLTVTYGLAPSAFLATRSLQQLANDEGEPYSLGRPALQKSFYVDDFIDGAQSVEEAIQLRNELSELLNKGGFTLRKWASNKLEVLQGLNVDQIGTLSALHFSPDETVKALGVTWEPGTDMLRFDSNIRHNNESSTKRSILSTIARLFDPLGLIAPIVVRAKILMQNLWLLSCSWDEPVPKNIQESWDKYHQHLPLISSYRIQRCAFLPNAILQLHTFSDASEAAYGACTYIRCEDTKGNITVHLLSSKSKVSPLKRITLARLELCAAVLAAQLHNRIKQAIEVNISASYFWSDSSVTLHWLKSPPNTWRTYVANRVSEIQNLTETCHWNHVSGKENPADLVSRGMDVSDFIVSELWCCGPLWLKRDAHEWPISTPSNIPVKEMEIRNIQTAQATIQTNQAVNGLFLRWSSYSRLLHVIGYCLRFANNAREKARTRMSSDAVPACRSLTVHQLEKAKIILIRLAQEDKFNSEIEHLKQAKSLRKQSKIRKLNPFLDSESVLRVGGRLRFSQLSFQAKHPALLPSNHPFTNQIAQYFHHKLLHGGGRLLLNAIREEYWPIQGRRLARSIVRNCFRCNRLNPEPAQQQIGQLPAHRVIPSRPFTISGVDYAGPLYLKPQHKRAHAVKSYLCLFVCFVTKAVHLELVSDLTTQAFLCSFRRFIARRGRPAHVYSDNGKNFEGASNQLADLFIWQQKQTEREKIISFCTDEGIVWHFSPPKAPHFGGLWEAAIKVAKKHLFRQLGSTRLSFEDMCTVLTQIEAQMNSRPLLPLLEDPNDLAALTPAHFLVGTTLNALPDPDLSHIPTNRLDHYQQLQLHVQKFWYHWRREYLQELQRDTVRAGLNEDIKPGRMVIVVDELQPPLRWPLARIISVHPGIDNITRVVSLRTAKGNITRPITKICLLPVYSNASGPEASDSETINPHTAIEQAELTELNENIV
ncbi:uncharacterized protein LOC129766910 [Toxorhynchites rutilus septentrionalis]|uniref:uncharacterized protein LOC129766910 n=1 Tax=Toxorhynchites rutilus septentrionalis TaxID=329112 RepID=UPI00247AA163|nr:uncharacterized protein LOC129766910 [Toxorhynchites rutilus septentrionalis]